MKLQTLEKREHPYSVGDHCGPAEPNVTEDTIFVMPDGTPVGLYIRDVSKHSHKLANYLNIANLEFNSNRVPKSTMRRSSGLTDSSHEVLQYSTIIGAVPAKANMRRSTHRMSSVHGVKSAFHFIKAMRLAAYECGELVKKHTPNIYHEQKRIISEKIPKQWRFSPLFTSSISNYNIAAAFHTDRANLRGCNNIIMVKKHLAHGGNTVVPEFGLVIDSCDNSLLWYPAWLSLHGVTPIEQQAPNGYRNSLVFYPLKALANV